MGKGMQQDVLRSQVEITLLLQRMTVLEQQRATAQARLNTFMARDPGSPLPPAASVEPAALNEKLDALYALAAKNDTSLQREQQMVEKSQLATQLAHKDYLPDFGVAYMYQQRPMLPDMNGMTFTVNVPVFYKTKQREEVRQATEETISAERSRDNRKNELQFELKQNYLAAQASKQLLDLYSKAVVPQSSLALESSMSAYEVGNVDFLTVLSNFSTILNYEVDYYRELANYQAALARMESLAGMELTSARSAAVRWRSELREVKEQGIMNNRSLRIAALVIAAVVALGAVYGRRVLAWQDPHAAHGSAQSPSGQRTVLYYYDAMNPQHHYSKPGKAPDGMDLVPQYADDNATGNNTAQSRRTVDCTRRAQGPFLVRPHAPGLQGRQAGYRSRLRHATCPQVRGRASQPGENAGGHGHDLSRQAATDRCPHRQSGTAIAGAHDTHHRATHGG